jgi:hypothetical protein
VLVVNALFWFSASSGAYAVVAFLWSKQAGQAGFLDLVYEQNKKAD